MKSDIQYRWFPDLPMIDNIIPERGNWEPIVLDQWLQWYERGVSMKPTMSPDSLCYDQGVSWKLRVRRAVVPDPWAGPVVNAILGVIIPGTIRYGATAVINKQGYVHSTVIDSDNNRRPVTQQVGYIDAVRDAMRYVADYCKLSDADREAFFEEIRKWIIKDERAESGLDVKAHN